MCLLTVTGKFIQATVWILVRWLEEHDTLLHFIFIENGIIIRIKIDTNNAVTPPYLLGMDRKIAQAKITG